MEEKESTKPIWRRLLGWALPKDTNSIHPWRWRLLGIWVIAFSIATILLVRSQREAINDLKSSKAQLSALRATNCRQYRFLYEARRARLVVATTSTGTERKANLAAAQSYSKLLKSYSPVSIGYCRPLHG